MTDIRPDAFIATVKEVIDEFDPAAKREIESLRAELAIRPRPIPAPNLDLGIVPAGGWMHDLDDVTGLHTDCARAIAALNKDLALEDGNRPPLHDWLADIESSARRATMAANRLAEYERSARAYAEAVDATRINDDLCRCIIDGREVYYRPDAEWGADGPAREAKP